MNWIKPLLLVLLIGLMGMIAWTTNLADRFDPNTIAEFLQQLGMLAPIVYIVMMTTAVVISPIPSLPLDAAAGVVFGPGLGTVYSVLGAEVGALIGFFLARTLGREAITRLFRSDIAFCDLCAERHLLAVIFISRLLPIFSFDLVSYGAGLTAISVRGFAIATLLGMIPPTFALNYFGSTIFSGSGYTFLLAALLAALFFLVPIWIKRRNPWGWYDRLSGGADRQ